MIIHCGSTVKLCESEGFLQANLRGKMYRLHTTSVLGNLKGTSTENFEFHVTVCLLSNSFFTDIFLNIFKCDGVLKSNSKYFGVHLHQIILISSLTFCLFTEIEDEISYVYKFQNPSDSSKIVERIKNVCILRALIWHSKYNGMETS